MSKATIQKRERMKRAQLERAITENAREAKGLHAALEAPLPVSEPYEWVAPGRESSRLQPTISSLPRELHSALGQLAGGRILAQVIEDVDAADQSRYAARQIPCRFRQRGHLLEIGVLDLGQTDVAVTGRSAVQ